MHLTSRRAGALLVAGLALVPLGSAHAMTPAASAAVKLRYHFVAGQTYNYQVTMQTRVGQPNSADGSGGAGALALLLGSGTSTTSGTVHYKVLSVNASGGATIRVSTSGVTKTETKNGQTTSDTPDAQAPYTIHVTADGRRQDAPGFDLGSFAIQAVGTLPAAPVAPGAQWNTTVSVSPPAELGTDVPPIQVPMQYVFSKVVTAGSQHAAAIDSTGTVQYAFDFTSQDGSTVHLNVGGNISGHVLFGLTRHQLVSSQTTMDLKPTLGNGNRLRLLGKLGPHVLVTVSIKPAAK